MRACWPPFSLLATHGASRSTSAAEFAGLAVIFSREAAKQSAAPPIPDPWPCAMPIQKKLWCQEFTFGQEYNLCVEEKGRFRFLGRSATGPIGPFTDQCAGNARILSRRHPLETVARYWPLWLGVCFRSGFHACCGPIRSSPA